LLAQQIQSSDARLASVIHSYSQIPKELAEKQKEKKSFWQRIFS